SIIAQVSLFNWVTYCVSLAREYPGERRDIRRGNFFDIANRENFGARNAVAIGMQAASNPQIERDAAPASLRLLARAPHLERWT
ncbi:MAG: hypothetical protein ACREBC_28810, partial [Pyrinomonadaceae bacterium]